MNRFKTAVMMVISFGLSVEAGQAAGPAFFDNFDGYAVGQNFVTSTNGWQASTAAVVVTNDQSQSGPNSVLVARQATLTNTVNGGSDKVIWTDCFLKPVPGEMPNDLPLDSSSLVAYFNPSGYVQVATSTGWVTCSNDVWGGAIDPATSGFARVSIYQNYSASNAALFINGRLALQDLRFVGSASAYNTFTVTSPSSNAWLDTVWIKTNYDVATLTNDINADGVADAAELAQYGYAARTLCVGGSGVPVYGSIAAAVSAWRARDTIYISGGTYAEDVVVSNAILFTGGNFTNTGTLTVSAASGPVFQAGMSWGAVTIDSNSLWDLNQTLVCSNLLIRAGATVTVANVSCSNLILESNARLNCLGTFACSGAGTLYAGATVVCSNSVAFPGILSLAPSASLVLSQGAAVGTLYCTGNVSVAARQMMSVDSAIVPGVISVSAGATVTVSTALSLPVGGHMDFTQSEFLYPPLSIDMSGTFSLSNNWGQGAVLSVSVDADCVFNQPLTNPPVSLFYLYAGSTSVFQEVTTTNLTVEDGARLTALGSLRVVDSLLLGQNDAAGLFNTVSCGNAIVVGTNTTATFSQATTCSNLIIRSGATVVMSSLACSNLVVEAGAHFTCQGAFVCYGACSFARDSVSTFSGTVSGSAAFTVDSGAVVTLNESGTLASLSVDGVVNVAAGKTLTVGNIAVAGTVGTGGGATLFVTSSLTVTGDGHLSFISGRLYVPSSSVDMTGTFTINNTWGQPTPGMPLPFVDDFETYTAGTRLSDLSFLGWDTTYTNVVVQSAVANAAVGGSKSVSLPSTTLVSSRITTSAKKVWTDCYLRPSLGEVPFYPPTNTAAFVGYVNTNGWLVIATSNGWDVCSNLVTGVGHPDRMTTSSWTRVSICQDLTNNTLAVFVNGKLVRQLLKAPGTMPSTYTAFEVDNADGQAYLDDVSIKETWPTTITVDLDRDLVVDAEEVDRIGSMTARNDWVGGTIYILR